MKRLLYILCMALFGILIGCSKQDPKTSGFEFYDAGNFIKALPQLERAYTIAQDDPELIVRLAYCLAKIKKDPQAALKILQSSTMKFPDYARTYYQLGFIAFQNGSPKDQENIRQALGFTRKAAQLDSSNFKIIDNLGMYHSMLGNHDSALFWFERAVRIDPQHPQLIDRIAGTRKLIAERAGADSSLAADTLEIGNLVEGC